MAKFSRKAKLSKSRIQDLVVDLCEAIAATKNTSEAAELLADLLGRQELEMLAKRLAIAELLLEGLRYEDIEKELKVGSNTIARVEMWLQNAGEGYRLIIERTKKRRKLRHKAEEPVKLNALQKKYPLYYWPQLVLQYWLHNSTVRQKREMNNILKKMKVKKQINLELEKLLSQQIK